MVRSLLAGFGVVLFTLAATGCGTWRAAELGEVPSAATAARERVRI